MAQRKNVTLYVGPAAENTKQGTVITSDFQFKNQKAIAVNSYSKVLEIYLEKDFNFLNAFFTQSQMAKPQLLFAKDHSYFISGPSEIIEAIEKFESKQQIFEIRNKSMSSVSVTFAKTTSDEDLQKAENLLSENKIKFQFNFKLMNSLHFFVDSTHRSEAIQILHKLTN
jgi:aspartokinase